MGELGLKKSIILRVFTVLCILLFLCYAGLMYLAFVELRTVEDLSLEERSELLQRKSIDDMMRLVEVFDKNENQYGSFQSIKGIDYVSCWCSSKKMAKVSITKDNILYFDLTKNAELVSMKEYDAYEGIHQKQMSGHAPSKESYMGVEVLFVYEAAKNDDILASSYDSLKAELEKSKTYMPAKQAVIRNVTSYASITRVSCAYFENDSIMAVKIRLESGEEFCCRANATSASAPYDSLQFYNAYKNQGKEVVYDGINLKVLINDLTEG